MRVFTEEQVRRIRRIAREEAVKAANESWETFNKSFQKSASKPRREP
jgi:hypothetical protein